MSVSLDLTSEEREQLTSLLDSKRGASASPLSLNDLFGQWMAFVEAVERGFDDSIYEYTNDLSVRDLLEDLMLASQSSLRAKLQDALAPIDARFASATEPAASPLGATRGALASWWHRVPKRRIGELADDLESMGHVE
jgi:hypothetical protein